MSTGLFSVTIRQALFIAPCSHTFHYKCIRPLLESHHPAFSCPLCRTFADLEEDVEVEIEYEEELDEIDGVFDKDVAGECDIDVDVEASDDHGHHQPGLDDVPPRSQSNSRLELRSAEREAGAETEVEGDGSGMGVVSRTRGRRGTPSGGGGVSGSGDRASPLADLTDEPDEEMMIDISQPTPTRGEMGLVVVGGDADEHMDLDGAAGAKRKR
jgi:E3 ubiquitin-protein ligase DMA1/2